MASAYLSKALGETLKVLFASCSEDLIPAAIEQMEKLYPELPLVIISEFAPPRSRWIPFPISRGLSENLSLFRWHFRDKKIRLSAVVLQPRVPYRQMRVIGFLMSPWNFVAFNENFGHFMLRPRSAGTMLRHFLWRARNFFVWQFSPGGSIYTLSWRVIHPAAFRRPLLALSARIAGLVAMACKSVFPAKAIQLNPVRRPDGISVVIPSRNGKQLLQTHLPEVVRQIAQMPGEIIVVDNGSNDGTGEFLQSSFPGVIVAHSDGALSFARAVNRGVRKARYSHVCLLNNDMAIEGGFFEALFEAFRSVPDLFCATAQIFFPPGQRREETGKAVMPPSGERNNEDFPVRCEIPDPDEDQTYVLYGSGGCSLFDTAKLLALRGLDEVYEPAYVEDLDLGFRAWQQAWPSVFVAGARVIHQHRATTSRYYSAEFLEQTLEMNYLRFLARAIASPGVFHRMWGDAVRRLNLLSAKPAPNPSALLALAASWNAAVRTRARHATLPDEHILAIGNGAVSVFPGRASTGRPRVLIATPYLPFPLAHGGAVRMYNLMRRAAGDVDLVLVSFASESGNVHEALLEICCEVVLVKRSGSHLRPSTDRPDVVEEFDSPAFHAALRETVRKWKPGIAQLEFTQMAQYAVDCAPSKTILVEHDVTFDLYQQLVLQGDDWELRRQLKRWLPFETRAWNEVDCVVTMSEKDRALTLTRGLPGSKVICLPNGVDLARFQSGHQAPESRRLLFIGSFAHLPNLLAVDFFLREVWPELKVRGTRLHVIAGARHQYFLDRYQDRVQPNLMQRGIELDDFVADVRPAYERATVVIAPLLASAGTNIKIMEAMAMAKAIVSTPAGINGLDLEPGRDVIVASTPAEMTQAILDLFENTAKREAIERQARITVERKFDWEVIARQQKAIYSALATGGGTRREVRSTSAS